MLNFQALGFYFINSPLRAFFGDFGMGTAIPMAPIFRNLWLHLNPMSKTLYSTPRAIKKGLWHTQNVAGGPKHSDTKWMRLLFWDGGSMLYGEYFITNQGLFI